MSRTLSLLNAGLFTFALALPAVAAAHDLESSSPSCDGPKTDGKGDKKNPSVGETQCDGPKTDGKGDKKNPSFG